MGRDDQLFSSSFCVFFIGLLFQQILFLHSNLKRRKVFGPVAFSLVWSPFYQERFHIANNSYLLAICKEWKLGLWRKRKKDFPEQRSAFQVLVWFFVCFGLGFFPAVQAVLTSGRGVHKGFTEDWVWAEDTYLAMKYKSRAWFQGSGLAKRSALEMPV